MGGILGMLVGQKKAGLTIGQAYQGGYYAGQISTAGNGVANFNLVVAPKSTGQSGKAFGTGGNTDPTSVIDGPGNSSTMNDASHPAAQFCEGLSIGGYSDWYMPAQNELEVCYYNLKPTTAVNETTSGINTNAVPSRGSAYSAGTPAQTSSSDFKSTGAECFDSEYYWTSTQYDFGNGRWQLFDDGYQDRGNKTIPFRVRAIRRVAV